MTFKTDFIKRLFIISCSFFSLLIVNVAISSQSDINLLSNTNLPVTTITSAQSRIIENNLVQKQYLESIAYIDSELKKNPNNTSLLYKKATIYFDLEQYDNAMATLNQLIIVQPKNSMAEKLKEQIKAIQSIYPRNELGINDDEAYVSDVNGYWTYTSLHYYRFTQYGTYGARINYTDRYGESAKQYQLEAYPTFPGNPVLEYINLSAAYANSSQTLFPNYQYHIEPYFHLPKNFETSFGFNQLRTIGDNIYTYTASLDYYWGNNYLWFRPYHYTPNSSNFYEVGIRHYFSDKNTFVSIKAGAGKAPDILDLVPLNQIIVINQKLVAINGQCRLHKNIYLQAGVGYTHQTYPSGNVRDITDGNLGIIWQF